MTLPEAEAIILTDVAAYLRATGTPYPSGADTGFRAAFAAYVAAAEEDYGGPFDDYLTAAFPGLTASPPVAGDLIGDFAAFVDEGGAAGGLTEAESAAVREYAADRAASYLIGR